MSTYLVLLVLELLQFLTCLHQLWTEHTLWEGGGEMRMLDWFQSDHKSPLTVNLGQHLTHRVTKLYILTTKHSPSMHAISHQITD